MHLRIQDSELFDWMERPTAVIALVARMLVGLGLAIAIVSKVYMQLLTDLRCDPATVSLGNSIRCVPTFDFVAIAIGFVAAVGFTAALFSRARVNLFETVMMALVAAILKSLSALAVAVPDWQAALVMFVLFAALILARRFVPASFDEGQSSGDLAKSSVR